MGCKGWGAGKGRHIFGLEWSGVDSWRRWHPGQRKCPEVENMVGDGGRAWILPESRALWKMLTTRLKR